MSIESILAFALLAIPTALACVSAVRGLRERRLVEEWLKPTARLYQFPNRIRIDNGPKAA